MDGIRNTAVAPDPEESPFEAEFEIEEVAEPTGPSQADLLKEFEALKAQNEELKKASDQSAALAASFGQLGERLEKATNRPAPVIQAPPPQQPGETTEQFRERINRQYLEDPYGTLVEFSNKYIGGAFEGVAKQVAATHRKLAFLESPDKDFISKYQEEIDAEVSRIPPAQQMADPDVYKRAIDTIRARHMDELVAAKVQAALAAAGVSGAAAKPAPVGASDVPVVPGAATPAASNPASSAAGGKRKIQITEAKKARIMSKMQREGIPSEKFNDYVQWSVEDGEFDSI